MEQLLHTPTSESEWAEIYNFYFGNREHNIHGIAQMEFKPNKKEALLFFYLFLPDGSVAGYRRMESLQSYNAPFKIGKMIFEPFILDNCWHFTFNDEMVVANDPIEIPQVLKNPQKADRKIIVHMDLFYKAVNELYDYTEHMTQESLEIGNKLAQKHWEQIATIEGTLQVGQELFRIQSELTTGQRNHSCGFRNWTEISQWLYFVVWFDENLCLNPMIITTHGNNKHCICGFIYNNGVNTPIKDILVKELLFTDDGLYPTNAELEIIGENDEHHILRAWVGSSFSVPYIDNQGYKGNFNQSMGSFEFDEQPGGHGLLEILHKLK